MKFDWTIGFGNIVTLAAMLAATVVGYVNLIRRIDRIETKVDMMYDWFANNILGITKKEGRGHGHSD